MKLNNTLTLAGTFLTACLAACGAGGDLNANGKTSASLMADDDVLAQVRLIEGDFEANNKKPECLVLRTKLFTERGLVKASSEWGTIKETNEYKTFDQDETQFNDSGCTTANPNTSEVCSQLESKLHADADALAKTAQWKTLDNNSHWHDLQEDYARTQQINCL